MHDTIVWLHMVPLYYWIWEEWVFEKFTSEIERFEELCVIIGMIINEIITFKVIKLYQKFCDGNAGTSPSATL